MKLNFILFLSSTRAGKSYTGNGSWGERVGKLVKDRVVAAGHNVSVWDPRVLKFPLLEQPVQMIPDKSTIPQWIIDRQTEIQEADGFLTCVGEYNAAIPPALVNMIDHFPPAAFRHRPCGIFTYSMGSGGGIRSQMPVKAFLTEMGMITVPATVKFDFVHKKFNGETDELIDTDMVKYVDRVVNETIWYAEAMKNHKEAKGLPSA